LKEPHVNEAYKAIGNFGTVGLEIALSILFGTYVGYWADGKLGTSPALVIVGFGFGCAAAVKVVHRAYKEMQIIAKREESEQGNPAPLFEKPDPVRKPDEPKDEIHEGVDDGRA
jgi:ATP synthase protein I